jgi:hypothetical protein
LKSQLEEREQLTMAAMVREDEEDNKANASLLESAMIEILATVSPVAPEPFGGVGGEQIVMSNDSFSLKCEVHESRNSEDEVFSKEDISEDDWERAMAAVKPDLSDDTLGSVVSENANNNTADSVDSPTDSEDWYCTRDQAPNLEGKSKSSGSALLQLPAEAATRVWCEPCGKGYQDIIASS